MISRRSGTQFRAGTAILFGIGAVADFAMVAAAASILVKVSTTAPDMGMSAAAVTDQVVVSTTAPDMGAAAVDADLIPTLLTLAEGAWLPAGLHDNGSGKVDKWANSGIGGTNYDLLEIAVGQDPTFSATGNRTGGPACTFVRASATRLATTAMTLNHPNTFIAITKVISSNEGQTILDGRTGQTHRLYLSADTPVALDFTGFNIVCAAALTVGNWSYVAESFGGSGANASAIQGNSTRTVGTLKGTGCSGLTMGNFGTGGGAAYDGVVEQAYYWDNRLLTANEISSLKSYFGA